MKKLLPFLLLASLPAVTFATEPNIFAYALGGNLVSHKEYEFIYSLNTPATSVDIIIYNADGTVAGTVPSSALDKGENKFTGELPQLEAGTYTWAVKASAGATEGGEYVTPENATAVLGAGADLNYTRIRGLATANNPAYPSFGSTYTTNGINNASSAFQQSLVGVMVWSPLMSYLPQEADESQISYTGDVDWVVGSQPSTLNDAFYGLDNTLYLSDWTDKHSGVWAMDCANPKEPFRQIFGGSVGTGGVRTSDGVQIAGSIASACTVGEGEELKLYTYDEDSNGGGIMRYDLGSKQTPWTEAPSKVIGKSFEFDGSTITLSAGAGARIRPDYHGGVWLAVNMTSSTYLLHFNSDDILDYCDTTVPTSITGAMAISTDGALMVRSNSTSGASQFSFFDVTYDADGKPTLTEHNFADGNNKLSCYTNNVRGLALDYACNLYAVTQGSSAQPGLSMYVMPKADNSTTVKAIEPIVLSVSTGIADSFAASRLSYNGCLISADTTVTVYSTTGLVVARGTQIATTEFAPGIYIAKAGDETIKIIK